jgi:hypothetical protein
MQVKIWESKKGGALTSDIVSTKSRSGKKRYGSSIKEFHGPLIWHDEVHSSGAQTSKNGGELTRRDHEMRIHVAPFWLACGHSLWTCEKELAPSASSRR